MTNIREIRHAATPYRRSMHRNLLGGLIAVLILGGGVGLWAAMAEVSGAVIAQGHVAVASNAKKVQHPTGGTVGRIFVRDGDNVEAGDLLVQLSDTIPRANLNILRKGLDELYARKSRLLAERDGANEFEPVPELVERLSDPDVARIVSLERRLFELRWIALQGNKARLRERKEQLEKQIIGLSAQVEAKAQEIALIGKEIQGIRQLWKNQLVSISRLTAYEREATRLEGERAQLVSRIAEARAAIAEVEIQTLQLEKDFSSQTAHELREVDAKIAEFEERRAAAEDQLSRINIRAPTGGTIHQSKVHTVGGVISAGEPIMLIVPDDDDLVVEVKVTPADIDKVAAGQQVLLRFPAFDLHDTPEIRGIVSFVAPDISYDERTNQAYYPTRIAPDPADLERLGGLQLIPGMPVEAFIETGNRRVISYLIKPIVDQMKRSFRET